MEKDKAQTQTQTQTQTTDTEIVGSTTESSEGGLITQTCKDFIRNDEIPNCLIELVLSKELAERVTEEERVAWDFLSQTLDADGLLILICELERLINEYIQKTARSLIKGHLRNHEKEAAK